MANVFSEKLVVSIDVGTTKICVLIAQHLADNNVKIIGIGRAPSDGLRKGVVIDVARTIRSIKCAVKEAELMAGVSVESAYVGISGAHIKSINSHGAVPIKSGEVRRSDIMNVVAAAQAVPTSEGQKILHILPQYFVIDSREKVQDPLGMYGIRLEMQAHIILGDIASVQNLIKCCEMAGVKVADVVLEQLASAQAVLSHDEREIGVAMLDIGGGTTDLAIYQHGNIRHTMVLPVAGNHLTNDIAIGLRTTLQDAERIKQEYALACMSLMQEDTLIEVEMAHGTEKRLVQLSELINIVEPRMQEIFSIIHEEILAHNLQSFITSGVVVTGGGALLMGAKELAEKIFGTPARIGRTHVPIEAPEHLASPIFATGYGLLIHAIKKEQSDVMERLSGPLAKRIFNRMKLWVSDFL